MSLLTPSQASVRDITADPDGAVALRSLDEHLERGGLDINGYEDLHQVLRMFGEVSLLLFPRSHSVDAGVMRRVSSLSNHIADAFHNFGEQIDVHLKAAQRAMQELPDLAVTQEKVRRHNLKLWRRRLRTLHVPNNNDVNLYRHFLAYYDTQVYCPVLQLHRVKPQHNIWRLRNLFAHVRDCMLSLEENVEEANKIVTELETEFTFGSWAAEDAQRDDKSGAAKQPLATKIFSRGNKARIPMSRSNTDVLESLDEFFEEAERVNGDRNLISPHKAYGIAAGGSEDGSTTPRVFTRSFDELEESIKCLRLHNINLSADDNSNDIKIKDFAPRTPLPSPATLLERQEALCARESTNRRIGGDRHRAQTVDERGGGLDAWLS